MFKVRNLVSRVIQVSHELRGLSNASNALEEQMNEASREFYSLCPNLLFSKEIKGGDLPPGFEENFVKVSTQEAIDANSKLSEAPKVW